MSIAKSSLVFIVFAACLHAPVRAQSGGEPAAAPSAQWGLGLGASFKRKAYIGIGNETSAIPVISYENAYLRFLGNTLDAKLGSAAGLSFTARAKADIGSAYEASDSPALAGMAERKGSIWLGGTAAWRSGDSKLSLEALADVSGHSKGRQLKFGAEHDFGFGQFRLTPYAAAIVRDANYVDYYFGVQPDEATSTRPAYAGRRTTDAELGLRLGYAIAPRQALVLDVSTEFLGSAVKASPIVGRSTVPAARLVYQYRF
jgi:MipA family protein